MKTIFALLMTIGLCSQAFAATTKICFGSKQNPDTQGLILKLTISKKTLKIVDVKRESFFAGTWKAYGSSMSAHDGKTYLEYEGPSSDQGSTNLIDSELLKPGTTGLYQNRSRGEGFFNSVFVCRDDDGN